MTLVQNIRTFIKSHTIQGTKSTWGLFILFAAVIFVKVIAFQWFTYHLVYVSSLWKNPSVFWGFWLPKVGLSLFCAFFLLVFKRKYWTILFLLICDLWIISNLVYFRANNCLLTWDAMMMASNLKGFGSSIGFYWNWHASFFLITTFVYAIILPFFKHNTSRKGSIIVGLVVLTSYFVGAEMWKRFLVINVQHNANRLCYVPLYIPKNIRGSFFMGRPENYAIMHSVITYFPVITLHALLEFIDTEEVVVTDNEKYILKTFQSSTCTTSKPTNNIVFLLIESFESFALEAKDINGNYMLPNFRNLINANTIYVPKLKSQVLHGVSIDGQQIVNTGLLPIQQGVAAMKYGRNVYPNFAHLFDTAVISNPSYPTTWNQHVVTYSYGYQTLLGKNGGLTDAEIFSTIIPVLSQNSDSTFCILALTMDSHSPFNRVPTNPALQFDTDMPQILQNYLTCLHYTDSCFGAWYNEWKETEQAKNTMLVITADHTIFKDAMLQEFKPYAQQAGLSIASGKTYCPLIIQAPQIEENIQITDVCYQMDVYPTIMHLIGCEDYYWKGFGVNLLDSTARHNRPITEEQAYQLSDKLIRADYFRELQ